MPQLRRRDGVLGAGLHRMRRLRRHLPDRLHLLRPQRLGGRAAPVSERPRGQPRSADPRLRAGQEPGGDGQGRRPLPALRAVRRPLSDRRVGHAEVHHRDRPGGTNMPIEATNDFVIRFANVNGSGSSSANLLFARSILRMGVPIAPRNIFPSNIQGLPTWYEVRVSERGWLGRARRRRHAGGDEPADLRPGCRGARARRLSLLRLDPPPALDHDARRHRRARHAADRDLRRGTIPSRASASSSATWSMSARWRR